MMTQVEGCPFGIDCLRVTEDNPLCGPARSNEFALETLELPPLPLAEDICPGLLELRFRLSVKEENEPAQAGKWWAQAWSQLELALPLADTGEAQKHFDNVDWLLGRVLREPEAALTKSIDAEKLRGYLPHFVARQAEAPYPHGQKSAIIALMDGLFTKIDAATRPLSRKRGLYVQAARHVLFSLSDLEYYPGSLREGHCGSEGLNHSGYAVIDGDKVPIRMRIIPRPPNQYSDRVLSISYQELNEQAISEAFGNVGRIGRKHIDQSLNIVKRRALGDSLERWEEEWMNGLVRVLSRQVIDFHKTAA